jgi:hypothetical protein
MLLASQVARSQAAYSEATALSSLDLSVSAYCGSPKYNATFLQNWDCGPSCSAAPVTDITQFEDSSKGIFGLVGKYDSQCLVLFRGTSSSDGWSTDLGSTSTVPFAVYTQACSGCGVGKGFYEGYVAVRPTILSALSSYGCKDITLTGHSLGAALATIAAMDLGQTYTINSVYNFGSPRAGNSAFASAYNSKYSDHWRVTHSKDPIPHAYFEKNGFFHIGQEAFYTNTTADGVKLCQAGEDIACSDQYASLYGNSFSALLNAPKYGNDHLMYMQNKVSFSTDGSSCAHVSVTNAVQQAYLSSAAYCSPEDLQKWDCGTPCDRVEGGVKAVQVLDVPFTTKYPDANDTTAPYHGAVRGFVGKVGDRCVLSLRDLFDNDEGLVLIKQAKDTDLEDLPSKVYTGMKIYRVVKDAWAALERPLRKAFRKAECFTDAKATSGRRTIVTGHGLGASLAALAAFQMRNGTGYHKGTFGIEPSFQFGATRIGNAAFVKAFEYKFGDDIFRVTHGSDAYVRYPTKTGSGFQHSANELHFKGDAAWDNSDITSYIRCAHDGEDPKCGEVDEDAVTDHVKYLQPLVEVDMAASSCKTSALVMV